MRKMRKGFTLVELLIVVAILGVLSATMMVTATGSTANAKAMTIADNVRSCRSAALLYYQINVGVEDLGGVTAKTSDVLSAHVSAWEDFNTAGTIKYTVAEGANTAETAYKDWQIVVDYSADTDKADISTALAKIPGFKNIGATGKFSVKLWDGTVASVTEGS